MGTIKIIDNELFFGDKYLKVPLLATVESVTELISDVNTMLESYAKVGGYEITVESMPNYGMGAIYLIAEKNGIMSGKVFFLKYYPTPEGIKKSTWHDKDGIYHISHT